MPFPRGIAGGRRDDPHPVRLEVPEGKFRVVPSPGRAKFGEQGEQGPFDVGVGIGSVVPRRPLAEGEQREERLVWGAFAPSPPDPQPGERDKVVCKVRHVRYDNRVGRETQKKFHAAWPGKDRLRFRLIERERDRSECVKATLMRPIPDDQFSTWWRAARSVAEVVEKACWYVGGAFPRWAVLARAVAGRKAGVPLQALPDEVPNATRRGEPELLARARETARTLMAKYGLFDWQFGFNRNVRRAGVCRYPTRTKPGRIELSRHFVEQNAEPEILDTILHEIAHALVGPEHGHDEVWKAKCREIGAKPERCYSGGVAMPKGRWRATCPSCSKAFDRHRRPKRLAGWHCKACGVEKGTFHWLHIESGKG